MNDLTNVLLSVHICRPCCRPSRSSPATSCRNPPSCVAIVFLRALSVILAFCATPMYGPLKQGADVLHTDPRLAMQLNTGFKFFNSNKSTVEKRSFSNTPSVRHAAMNAEIFSICLKGMACSLQRGHMSGCSWFANRMSTLPSFSQSPNVLLPLVSPVTTSIQDVTSSSKEGPPAIDAWPAAPVDAG